VAVQFLTRIPVRVRFEPGDLRRAAGAFPAVGALVAAVGVGVRWALAPWLDTQIAAIASLAAMVLATGALHEDGFADAADGWWGGRMPDDRLRIMRDSRLGTYGTLALVFLFATKLAVLAPMTPRAFAVTLIPAMVLGRGSSLVLMRAIPPVPDGLAALAGPPPPAGWAVAGVTCALSLAGFGSLAWLPLAAAGFATLAVGAIVRRRVGGLTGDQLGAANQFVEVAVLLAGRVVFGIA
jgi:adenosylcobinamide-GDP ribazoletransferase